MRLQARLLAPILISLTLMVSLLLQPQMPPPLGQAAWAAPVSWQEVPPGPEGRQWWDSGSLRLDRQGHLSVLSRFQPALPADQQGDPSARAPRGTLYVMQLDCDQQLWRDQAVNGLPRPRAPWEPAGQDTLIDAVLEAACQAAAETGITGAAEHSSSIGSPDDNAHASA